MTVQRSVIRFLRQRSQPKQPQLSRRSTAVQTLTRMALLVSRHRLCNQLKLPDRRSKVVQILARVSLLVSRLRPCSQPKPPQLSRSFTAVQTLARMPLLVSGLRLCDQAKLLDRRSKAAQILAWVSLLV